MDQHLKWFFTNVTPKRPITVLALIMQTFAPALDGYYDVGYQMHLDLRQRVREHTERRLKEKQALCSLQDWDDYHQQLRQNFLRVIGDLPTERCPLNARITATLERETFSVQKLIYESLPNFPVTAACYVPRDLKAPAATVVMLHGHTTTAKSAPMYQAVCVDLVNNGFVVLAIDPIGQGERHQLDQNEVKMHADSTLEHTHLGTPFWLRGASLARHFIWDIMRGIDYLETRPDVDPTRIGVTGCSGGGLQTSYTMLLEPRVAAAVPCTFLTTLESYQKTGQPQDAEQIIPGCMISGPDHDDFLTAFAPRPVLVGAAGYDFFPIEGTLEAVERAKAIYALHGKEENLAVTVAPVTHQYAPQLRESCVNWFRQHLQGAEPNFVTGTPKLFDESELWATKSGEIYRDFPEATTVMQLNDAALPKPTEKLDAAVLRSDLSRTLGIEKAGKRTTQILARITSDEIVDGYRTEKIFFQAAPSIMLAGVLVHPRGADSQTALPATLLLLEHGTNDIPQSRPLIESILETGHRVFIFDVRGVGSLTEYPNTPEIEFETHNVEYKLGCDAMMLGISTLGLRVFDLLRGYDYLRGREDVGEIHLYGCDSGAIFALLAAVLSPDCFTSVTCEGLTRYRELASQVDYDGRLLNLKRMAWGLLKCGDIDDWIAALVPCPVTLVMLGK